MEHRMVSVQHFCDNPTRNQLAKLRTGFLVSDWSIGWKVCSTFGIIRRENNGLGYGSAFGGTSGAQEWRKPWVWKSNGVFSWRAQNGGRTRKRRGISVRPISQ